MKSLNIKYSGFENHNNLNVSEFSVMKVKMDTLFRNHLPYLIDENHEIAILLNTPLKENNLNKKIKSIDDNNSLKHFFSVTPKWSMEQVILSDVTKREIEKALLILSHSDLIFNEWNLKSIIPNSKAALNFFGPAGTGKTMCAHAVANKLGKNIMCLNYAQIESKFVGDAPKNVDSAFEQAEHTHSLLFFDEADSLLGKRISNVTTGSEQAINSLRSQMLIAIENFNGIVIFATNLIENFDSAFESRIQNINFPLPDYDTRIKIWKKHIPEELPLFDSIDFDYLSSTYSSFSGRDIRNAILGAVTDALVSSKKIISFENFKNSCENILSNKYSNKKENEIELNNIKNRIIEKIKEK